MNQAPNLGIVVGVGECRVAAFPTPSLNTYALGSCLAVVVYDWKKGLGGMLHFMLPDSSIDRGRSRDKKFVYADTGIPELIRRFEIRGGSRHRMRCCITGGARMMTDPACFRIGERNHIAVRKALSEMGIFVDCEDVGGTESRSVRLDLSSGRIDLRTGGGPGKVLLPPGVCRAGMAGR